MAGRERRSPHRGSVTIREQIQNARQQELLTVEQLALLAQYNPKSIYRKVARNEINGIVRFGRGIRFIRTVAIASLRRSAEAI